MTIEELRVLITAKTESLQEGIKKATSRLDGFRKTSDNMSSSNSRNIEKMKNQYDNLIKKLDIVNAQAEAQQRKLDSLRDRYSRYSGVRLDSPEAARIQEQILRAESRLHSLISTSDKTVGKISELEDKMNGVGVTTGRASSRFKGLRDRLDQIRDRFSKTGRSAERSASKISGFATMLDRSLRRVLRRIFIYNLIYKMIRGFAGYVDGALKTNDSFVRSLNTIKTNLRVAFQPIYDFVLPAIQALMRWLATLTSYIASFTSALFGRTYKQSYDAAKGIETAKKEMERYGNAAKKAKGQLAAFDEINVLSKGDGGKSDDFEMEMPDLTEIDEGPITRLRNLLAGIFKPFKGAWNNEGQNTINSAKNALNSMKLLITEIGSSFKNVWTGGSGQEILETRLRILQQIFDLVGNIADSFRIAWAENETGTKIIQGITNVYVVMLGIVQSIGESLNYVWGEVGQVAANTFMAILESTVRVLETLAIAFRLVWDNGGKYLFENLIMLGAKIFELAGYIYTEFVSPFAVWFIELIAPAIGVVMDFVARLLAGFTKLIDWMLSDGKPVLDTIVTVLGSMAVAFGIVQGSILAFKGITAIATGVVGVFGVAMAAVTSPIGLVTLAIGAVIAIGTVLYQNWDELSVWIVSKWNDIITGITRTKNNLIRAVMSPFEEIDRQIKKVISNAKNWGINLIQNFIDGIRAMIGRVREAATNVANAVKNILGFSSPTKEGPGRYADKWMPNLMNMLADGIERNIYKVESSVNLAAQTLRGIGNSNNADSIADAIAGAISNNTAGDTTIIVKIGDDTITEKVISNINRRSRISGKTVLQI